MARDAQKLLSHGAIALCYCNKGFICFIRSEFGEKF